MPMGEIYTRAKVAQVNCHVRLDKVWPFRACFSSRERLHRAVRICKPGAFNQINSLRWRYESCHRVKRNKEALGSAKQWAAIPPKTKPRTTSGKKRNRQWLPARSRTKKWAEKTRNRSTFTTEDIAPIALFMVEAKGFDPSTVWSQCGSKNDANQNQLCRIVYLRRRQDSQVSQGGAKLR